MVNAQNSLFVCTIVAGRLIVTPAVEPRQSSSAETDQGMELLSANPTVEQPTVEVDVTLPSQEDRGQEVTVALAEPEKELPERHAADVAVEPRQSSSAEVDQGMEIPSVERGGLCRPRSVLWK